MSAEAKKGHPVSWNWGYRPLEPPCRCWKSTPGPLGEQSRLFAAELFLQPALNIISFKCTYLFRDRVSLCNSVTPYRDQAGLELRDPSVSTS